jgi:O-antigen ligase
MSPEWREHHPPENAHNNFLQVLAEVGVAGLAALLSFLGVVFWEAWRRTRTAAGGPWRHAAAAGLLAFMMTWATGHPMLMGGRRRRRRS